MKNYMIHSLNRCKVIVGSTLLATLLLPALSFGQGKLQQGFETTDSNQGDEFRYTYNTGVANVGLYSGSFVPSVSTNNNAGPAADNVAAEGTRSFGAVNNTGSGVVTGVIDFERTGFHTTTGNYLSFRLASFQTNSSGGMDNSTSGNGVTVSIAYNGSATYTPTLKIIGTGNGSQYSFSATGTAPATLVTSTTPTLTTVNSPDDLAGGFSTARIDFGAAITSVAVRITLESNGKTALFIDDVVLGSSAPLPVELASFTGSRQASAVLLKWTTAQELNNDHFDVQRSAEGRDYQTIGTVQGKGTTSAATAYSFADAQPLSGANYYRLRQVDRDGTVHYSPVVVVQGGKRQVLLTPNPTISHLGVRFTGEAVQWRILSPIGQALRKGTIAANATLNVSDLRPGAYFFEVMADGQRSVQKFIKAE